MTGIRRSGTLEQTEKPAIKKADPVREFLYSIQEAHFNVQRCQRRLLQMESQSESMTAKLSGAPGGSADVHKDGVLAALADQRTVLRELYAEAVRKETEVERFISLLEEDSHRILLRLRYVDLLTWTEVQEAMKQSNIYYSERQIYRIHGEALQEARGVWARLHPDGGEEDKV